jgi:hypothetical protein
MKNGKILFSVGTIVLFFSLKKLLNNKKIILVDGPTIMQLKNRLDEFCLSDIEIAKNEFEGFMNLGLSPKDAFELTIVKRVYV